MNERVFISYKSEEFAIAESVRKRIEDEGIACWMAPQSIEGGKSYAQQIPNAIQNCEVFVLILSERSMRSIWVARELDRALNKGKYVLPFMIERLELSDEFSFYLANVQQYPAYAEYEHELERMVTDIRLCLGFPKNNMEDASAQTAQTEPDTEAAGAGEESEYDFEEKASSEANEAREQIRDTEKKKRNKASSEKADRQFTTEIDASQAARRKTILIFAAISVFALFVTIVGIMLKNYWSNLNAKVFVEIADLSPVDIQSTMLEISGKTLTQKDVHMIGRLESLRTLRINDCRIEAKDLSPLGNAKNIFEFSLAGSDLSQTGYDDLGFLSQCERIVNLDVHGCRLNSLEGIEKCIRLAYLNASNCGLTSLQGLENATILKRVHLSSNRLKNIDMLSKSSETLEQLYVGGNELETMEAFAELPKLRILNVMSNKLSELSCLTAPELKTLVVIDNPELSSLPLFAQKLEALYAANCAITELDWSSSAPDDSSRLLELKGNPLASFSLGEGRYFRLSLVGVEMNDQMRSELMKADIEYLFMDYDSNIDWTQLDEQVSRRIYLFDCPLDKRVAVENVLGYKVNFSELDEYEKLLAYELLN
ncbi:MAG: TIR domain-containing protein [Clostridia bacterium]|nr:TIR domain-containing protein [Clostridia bacterium]